MALDEVAAARKFTSKDEREAALLRYLQALLENGGRAPMHLHEEAREADSLGASEATLAARSVSRIFRARSQLAAVSRPPKKARANAHGHFGSPSIS